MHASFWFLQDYVPQVRETTRVLEPGYVTVAEAVGADVDAVIPLLVPRDMQDGVLGALLVPARGLPGPGGAGQLLRVGAG